MADWLQLPSSTMETPAFFTMSHRLVLLVASCRLFMRLIAPGRGPKGPDADSKHSFRSYWGAFDALLALRALAQGNEREALRTLREFADEAGNGHEQLLRILKVHMFSSGQLRDRFAGDETIAREAPWTTSPRWPGRPRDISPARSTLCCACSSGTRLRGTCSNSLCLRSNRLPRSLACVVGRVLRDRCVQPLVVLLSPSRNDACALLVTIVSHSGRLKLHLCFAVRLVTL
jgi:hypothetical protein